MKSIDRALQACDGYKDELIMIAKAYCKKIGAKFLFVNEHDGTFGYEKNGKHYHISFEEMANRLR